MFVIEVPRDIGETIKKGATSSELILGVRSEDILVRKEGEPGAFKAEVYAMEPLGRDVIVNLKLDDIVIKMVTTPAFRAGIGEGIWVGFDFDKMHIFDSKTEEAIL